MMRNYLARMLLVAVAMTDVCRSPVSQSFDSSGGSGSIDVLGTEGCVWTPTASNSWLSITASTGIGSGWAAYSVLPNPGTSVRTGSISVGDRNITIKQGIGCSAVPDAWQSTSLAGSPPPTGSPNVMWTGHEMLEWSPSPLNSGARYDPVADSWRPISAVNAPSSSSTAIWTGSEMIVLETATGAGAAYNPLTDMWRCIASNAGLWGHAGYTAAWTGNELITFGGYDAGGNQVDTGFRYNPEPTIGVKSARYWRLIRGLAIQQSGTEQKC